MTRHPTRRLVTAGLLLLPTLARAAPSKLSEEDQALVDQAVAYLQGLTRARGRFTQVDSRGKRAPGDIYLQRPGKVRFEYDPPNNDRIIISDGYQVETKYLKLKTSERWPLRTTPLALFLAKEIRLDRGVVVTKVERQDDGFAITAQDGGHDTRGRIVINFAKDPIALRGWTIIEGQQATRFQIDSLNPVGSLDPSLFKVLAPTPKPKA
jgi:outer membrane lipoprotein-sorting protein